ncbi:MAG: sigma-70 family RNA polymerase sigma factor [Ignavibacteriales bacterium]|nr:sigma-70 family RNA polymerase sigma factor [Ignavibacteriales bacterium]
MDNNELWGSYKSNPNPDIKKQIVLRYSNLVHYVIQHSRFPHPSVIEDRDFYQFGIEGLFEAIDKFDPNYGTKFETYAIPRIKGKIIDEIRKLQIKPRSDSPDDIKYVNVSLNDEVPGEEGFPLYETIASDAKTPSDILDKNEEKLMLLEALKKLNERDRLLLTLYYYENLNYQEIAEVLNISVSRVSQIHSKVITKLRSDLKYQYA